MAKRIGYFGWTFLAAAEEGFDDGLGRESEGSDRITFLNARSKASGLSSTPISRAISMKRLDCSGLSCLGSFLAIMVECSISFRRGRQSDDRNGKWARLEIWWSIPAASTSTTIDAEATSREESSACLECSGLSPFGPRSSVRWGH